MQKLMLTRLSPALLIWFPVTVMAQPDFSDVWDHQGCGVAQFTLTRNACSTFGNTMPRGIDPDRIPESYRCSFEQPSTGPGQRSQPPLKCKGPGSNFIMSDFGCLLTNEKYKDGTGNFIVGLIERRDLTGQPEYRYPCSEDGIGRTCRYVVVAHQPEM